MHSERGRYPKMVSVPLRGKGRDQPISLEDQEYINYLLFPSPCGEKVGINSSLTLAQAASRRDVSVPLRGKGRDQHELAKYRHENERDVSVPLRGKGRDQPD